MGTSIIRVPLHLKVGVAIGVIGNNSELRTPARLQCPVLLQSLEVLLQSLEVH
jgi:hypothetical protein